MPWLRTIAVVALAASASAGGTLGPTKPKWPPTYDMGLSTLTMQCNGSGFSSPERGGTFGVVSYDWSNAKKQWAAAKPMNSADMLFEQAKMTKAKMRPGGHVFVYRNIVKALPWMGMVREKLDDPAYSSWFLKFSRGSNGSYHVPACAAENKSKCSEYYHDQEQTPEVVAGDGACTDGYCDCGAQPCGEYLFDFRNGSMLQNWIVDELIAGPTGVGAKEVDGLFIDDYWCSDLICKADSTVAGCPCGDPVQGPSEINKYSQSDIGLSDEDVRAITLGWNLTMGKVQQKILDMNAYTWSLIKGQENANASPFKLTPSRCAAVLEEACRPGSMWQKNPMLFGLSLNGTQLLQLEQDLAFFLMARGDYAWAGWGTWGMTWPFNPEPAHGELPPLPHGVPRPTELDLDYGVPSGLCKQSTPGVFSRAYTKYHVGLDCNTFTATLSPKMDPIA